MCVHVVEWCWALKGTQTLTPATARQSLENLVRRERRLCSLDRQLLRGGEDVQARPGAGEEAAGSSRTLNSSLWGMLWVLTTPGLVRSSGGKRSRRKTGCMEKGGKLQDRDVRTVVLYQGSCVRFTGRGGELLKKKKVQIPVSSSRAVSCQFRAQGESRAPPDAGAGVAGLWRAQRRPRAAGFHL